jgi:glycosyltransferase involved in cell wall biosynthesis
MAAGRNAAARLMFSVVIPVWNKRHTLRRTVESALAQSFRDFELILVDDASIDGSLDVVVDIEDARLRRLHQANAGPGAARNAGMAAARHDWIAFLDADDLWLPFHLEELDAVRAAAPRAALISTSYVNSDPDGLFALPDDSLGRREEVCYFDRIAAGELAFCTSCAAVQRGVALMHDGFRPIASGEDSEFWARIALQEPVARSTRVTAVYMHGTGGISDTAGTRWKGKPLDRLEQLSPAVAVLLERRDRRPAMTLAAIDRYIDRSLDWCLRGSIRHGDIATLRALPRIYPRKPSPEHRLLLGIARLPAPLAWGSYRLGFRIKSVLRRLSRGFSSSARGRGRAIVRSSRPAA